MVNLDNGHPGCCGCMSIRSAARLVAVFTLIISILSFFNIVGIIFSVFLLVAVFSGRPQRGFVLAFLVYWLVFLICIIGMLIFGIIIVKSAQDYADRNPWNYCGTSDYDGALNSDYYDNCGNLLKFYQTMGYVIISMAVIWFLISAWLGFIILIYYRNMETYVYAAPQQAVYVVPGQPSFGQPGVVQYAPTYQAQPQPYYGTQGQPQQWQYQQQPQYIPPPYATVPPQEPMKMTNN